ncbi:DNA polymerase IV [Serinibacter salmoneus]|uniref:DNA polymerase IV n=1 Tax=Serinibacter salmoneus TaxID=556530 RepID=A0A2A9D253_9MICO|nr:DNA polymerase IV [Serinibacter salmoneus]PFG20451.1 DNA polymerase-4 [Serinibacter salmoneus]
MNAGAQWAGSPRGHEGEAGMLHADLDCFFASVAQRDDPRLRGRPVAVGGGVILAASYEARRAGVRSAMSGREARARCPDLVLVPTDFDAYTRASRQVMALFRETTPVVRVMSIDEAFLDVRGLRHLEQSPLHVARRLRARVSAQVGLTVSVGVARTPFLAKMASTASKPNGLLLIPPEGEDAFLHPLPLARLWGIGDATTARLARCGLHTAGDLAQLPREVLLGLLGSGAGARLHALVHSVGPERLHEEDGAPQRGSIGAQRALGRGPHTPSALRAHLLALVDRTTGRLRGAHLTTRRIELRLRLEDYSRASRSSTLTHPVQADAPIARTAVALLDSAWPLLERRGCTLVGIALAELAPADALQEELDLGLSGEHERARAWKSARDSVTARHGHHAVVRASSLGARPRA